jgi:hypothetical protein
MMPRRSREPLQYLLHCHFREPLRNFSYCHFGNNQEHQHDLLELELLYHLLHFHFGTEMEPLRHLAYR